MSYEQTEHDISEIERARELPPDEPYHDYSDEDELDEAERDDDGVT